MNEYRLFFWTAHCFDMRIRDKQRIFMRFSGGGCQDLDDVAEEIYAGIWSKHSAYNSGNVKEIKKGLERARFLSRDLRSFIFLLACSLLWNTGFFIWSRYGD